MQVDGVGAIGRAGGEDARSPIQHLRGSARLHHPSDHPMTRDELPAAMGCIWGTEVRVATPVWLPEGERVIEMNFFYSTTQPNWKLGCSRAPRRRCAADRLRWRQRTEVSKGLTSRIGLLWMASRLRT